MPFFQVPDIILPVRHPLGTETELINDAVVHYSLSIEPHMLDEKLVQIYGTLAFGAPGALRVWVEIAQQDTAALYTMVGVESTLVVTGSLLIAWTIPSAFARLAVQAPGASAIAFWAVVALHVGKGKY